MFCGHDLNNFFYHFILEVPNQLIGICCLSYFLAHFLKKYHNVSDEVILDFNTQIFTHKRYGDHPFNFI